MMIMMTSSGTGRYVKLCIHLLLKSHTNGRNSATQIGHVSIFGNTAMWFNGHVVQRHTYGHVVQRHAAMWFKDIMNFGGPNTVKFF